MTTKLQILNTDFKLLTIVENTNKNLPLISANINESLQPFSELSFVIPEKEEDSVHVKIGNYVLYKDLDNKEHLYIISVVEEINAEQKEIYCEHISTELADEHLEVVEKRIAPANECISAILLGSDWKVGTVDNLNQQSFNTYYTNKLDALNECADKFKGELVFETAFVKGVLVKTVHLLRSRGSFTGKRFEYGKDILNIRRTVDMTQIKTAIYGYGASSKDNSNDKKRVNFSNVVWSSSMGHPLNKPKGQKFIGDNQAKALYGLDNGKKHRYGMLDAGEVTDPETLLILANAYLNRVNKPKVTYEMSVIELERLAGFEHEKIRLGDTVIVLDYEFQQPIKVTARVIEIKGDLLNPEKTEVVLGNFKEVFTDIYDKVKDLETAINNNTGIWNNKLDSMDLSHYAEFGSLIYEGTANETKTFSFSQIYTESPVIHAQTQLIDEDISAVTEVPQVVIKAIKTGDFYTGAMVKIIRSETTSRKFLVTLQSYCSSPDETTV